MNQGQVIRFLVVGLPAGLLLFGVIAMFSTHMKSDEEVFDPNEEVRIDAAALNRKPVAEADLKRYLTILTEQIGERNMHKPDALESAAVWIESTLGGANIGYQVERQEYEIEGQPVRNLIAELPGRADRSEIIVVGAHYDTVSDCPGANDNGTGIAALVSLAQAFAGDPQGRTIRFVAFVNEEPPYFQTDKMGSVVYAQSCEQRGENIVAMMSLDTIGYYSDEAGSQRFPDGLEGAFPETGNFLAFVANEQSRFILDGAIARFRSATDLPVEGSAFLEGTMGVGWSDHSSFWQSGYPAIMVTDTAPFRYPHYHEPTDTLDKIDFSRYTEAVKGLEAAIRGWADM